MGLAVVLAFGLTACGEDKKEDTTKTTTEDAGTTTDETTTGTGDDQQTTSEAVDMSKATEQKWGDFTISVPEGWEFRKGDALDDNYTGACSVKKSTFSYFDLKSEKTEENMMNQYNYNKQTYTNEQSDVSGKIGDIDWTGFQYSDGFGGYGFELYAKTGGKFIRVSSAGFKFDDPTTTAVLGTLKV